MNELFWVALWIGLWFGHYLFLYYNKDDTKEAKEVMNMVFLLCAVPITWVMIWITSIFWIMEKWSKKFKGDML